MPTKYVDISGSVTKRTHEKVLNDLLEQFEQWRNEMGWCTDLYKYVQQLTSSYHWDPEATGFYSGYSGHMTVQTPSDMTPEQRGQDLRDVRGRVLRFTLDQSDTINMGRANEFLKNARLAPWSAGDPETRLVYASVGIYTNTTLTDEQVREALRKAAQSLGSSTSGADLYVNEQDQRRSARIPLSETVELLPRPRYI